MRLLVITGVLLAGLLGSEATLRAQISFVEHGPFQSMLDTYTALNRDPSRRLDGFRVQIISTTDRLMLEETLSRFERLYPGLPADWSHEPPYYKLRTGAFTDRELATAFLYRIKRHFPSAYPTMVRDIRPTELLTYR